MSFSFTFIGNYDIILPSYIPCMSVSGFGHVIRGGGLANTFMQGTVLGKRGRGRPKTSWGDNIRRWTGLGSSDLQAGANIKEGYTSSIGLRLGRWLGIGSGGLWSGNSRPCRLARSASL